MVNPSTGDFSSTRVLRAFFTKGGCSETLFHLLNRAFGHSETEEERASPPLSGGVVQHGYQCGMIWGAALAAGAQAFRRFGEGLEAQIRAIRAARRATEVFQAQNATTYCSDITELNASSSTWSMINYFLIQGGTVGCARMAMRYAPAAFQAIRDGLAEEPAEVPPGPVSCASLVAEKMGASGKQVVMAAGLAGGIGLSGGACGALGAALWMSGLAKLREGAGKVPYKAPENLARIERFLACADYEFECRKITGRAFESVEDHAGFVCAGGCSRLLEVLAGRPEA